VSKKRKLEEAQDDINNEEEEDSPIPLPDQTVRSFTDLTNQENVMQDEPIANEYIADTYKPFIVENANLFGLFWYCSADLKISTEGRINDVNTANEQYILIVTVTKSKLTVNMFDGLSWETFLYFTVNGLGEVIKNMVQSEPFMFELALPSDVLLSKKQAKIELTNIFGLVFARTPK
jgi:hypothetical protein